MGTHRKTIDRKYLNALERMVKIDALRDAFFLHIFQGGTVPSMKFWLHLYLFWYKIGKKWILEVLQ